MIKLFQDVSEVTSELATTDDVLLLRQLENEKGRKISQFLTKDDAQILTDYPRHAILSAINALQTYDTELERVKAQEEKQARDRVEYAYDQKLKLALKKLMDFYNATYSEQGAVCFTFELSHSGTKASFVPETVQIDAHRLTLCAQSFTFSMAVGYVSLYPSENDIPAIAFGDSMCEISFLPHKSLEEDVYMFSSFLDDMSELRQSVGIY